MRNALHVLLVSALACHSASVRPVIEPVSPPLGVTGTIRFHGRFPSRFVAPRNIEVWLPPMYDTQPRAHFPVVYVHDGQNVFAPATSFARIDWGVDETMTRLIAEQRVRPAIVVAIWNTADRFSEYTPRKPLADAYLHFIVDELKPFVDSTYRTRRGPEDTFFMGSSMGGLIALYGMLEYPRVIGGAASLSTHWPVADSATRAYLFKSLPKPGGHRFYFDYGTVTVDSLYAPLQAAMDSSLRAAGYVPGPEWSTRVFPGADHSERSWRLRVSEPLMFLLGRP